MPDESIQAAIGPPIEPDYLRPVYANTAHLNFTPHDFRLTFSLLGIPLELPAEEARGGNVQLRPQAVASVVLPATLMHALIGLLQGQFDQYLQQFGPPGLDPEGPRGPID